MTAVDLVRRIVEAEARALDRGDDRTADVCADMLGYVISNEWHEARYWRSVEDAMGDYLDRLERLYAAIGRAA